MGNEIKAIKESIVFWQEVMDMKVEHKGYKNYPLCDAFRKVDCVLCPVCQKTGVRYCGRTPYTMWISHQTLDHYDENILYGFKRFESCQECYRLIKLIINFLGDLQKEYEDERG